MGEAGVARRIPAWLVPVALYAVALAARLPMADMPFYGDETAHYYVARHLGAEPGNVAPASLPMEPFLWQRPLFSLLLAPFAQGGFESYRVGHVLLGSLLPVALWGWLRACGTRPVLAAAAGVAVAAHPSLALWGARAFPDTLMATLFAASLWARRRGRLGASSLLLLASVWAKEVALVGVAGVLAWDLWTGRRAGRTRFWPLQLDRAQTADLAVLAAAPLPLAVAVLVQGGAVPGWSTTPLQPSLLDGFFLSAWLLPLVLAGLAWPRTRAPAGLALLFPGFFLAYALLLGRGLDAWYAVLPATLAAGAAALAADEAWRRWSAPSDAARRALAAVPLVAVLLVPLAGAGSLPQAILRPATGDADGLAGTWRDSRRPGELEEAMAAVPADAWDRLFVADVGWFHLAYPLADRAGLLGWAYTDHYGSLPPWAEAVEAASDATLLRKTESALNLALRETYADCIVHESGAYVVVDGPACAGRGDRLEAAFRAHGAPPSR